MQAGQRMAQGAAWNRVKNGGRSCTAAVQGGRHRTFGGSRANTQRPQIAEMRRGRLKTRARRTCGRTISAARNRASLDANSVSDVCRGDKGQEWGWRTSLDLRPGAASDCNRSTTGRGNGARKAQKLASSWQSCMATRTGTLMTSSQNMTTHSARAGGDSRLPL